MLIHSWLIKYLRLLYEKEQNPKENTVMRKLLRIYRHIHHKTGRVSTVNVLEIALFCESCHKNTRVKDELGSFTAGIVFNTGFKAFFPLFSKNYLLLHMIHCLSVAED